MSDPIRLAPKLDLSAASALTIELKERLGEAEIVLDLTDVRHLGALCLQVMLAAATSALQDGRRLVCVNASDRVIDQLRVMGMTPEMISEGRQ
ncbi:MAG: STAS domain-containing protein [Pseudomonadota bacterium]